MNTTAITIKEFQEIHWDNWMLVCEKTWESSYLNEEHNYCELTYIVREGSIIIVTFCNDSLSDIRSL